MNLDKFFLFFAKILKKYTNFMIWNNHSLDSIIKDHSKLIIIFGHPLCGVCKKIMFKIPLIYPYYKFKGYTLKFSNVKENCERCIKNYNINVVPTLIIYKNWKEVKRYEGHEVLENLFNID